MRVKRLLRANSEWTLAGVGNLQRWSIPLPFFWFFHLLSSCRVIAVRQDHSGTATSGLRLYSKTKRDLEKWCLQPVDRLSPICSSEQFQKKGGPISNSFCLRACLCGLMSVFPYFHLIPFLYMLFSFLSFRFLSGLSYIRFPLAARCQFRLRARRQWWFLTVTEELKQQPCHIPRELPYLKKGRTKSSLY